MRRTAVAALTLAAAVSLQAAVRGPDASGYTGTDAVVYSFVDVSGSGASVLAGTDDGAAALTLPFPFTFYGQTYALACVSSNGALYFVASAASCTGLNDFANVDLALTTPNDWPALFPLWSDLTFQAAGGGAVAYQTVGAAGTRRFVVQWNHAVPVGAATPVTFEIVLAEGTNTVTFQYKTVSTGGGPASNGGQATVGIRNAGGAATNQQVSWSANAPVLHDASAILFSAALTPTLTVADATATYDGQPHAVTAAATGVNGEPLGPVTVTYNGSTTAPTGAGTYHVVASLAASGTYAGAVATATLTIDRAVPTIAWPAPAAIAAGTALGAAELDATASVPGTFVYTPPAGTVLPAGSGQTLVVVFTPVDAVDYATASATVQIDVVASSEAGHLVGEGGIDAGGAQTRFAFDVRTRPGRERGELRLRTRPNRPAGRDGDDDRDDRFGRWDRFEATAITSATATNTPGVSPGRRPGSGVDTLTFSGVGRWNGAGNYRFTATAVDAGEPGRGRDQFTIAIVAPNGAAVLSVTGTLTSGNIQSVSAR